MTPAKNCSGDKKMHHDNIMSLTGQPGERHCPSASSLAKGVVPMSTYEEFMVILTVALLIVAILSYTHKK